MAIILSPSLSVSLILSPLSFSLCSPGRIISLYPVLAACSYNVLGGSFLPCKQHLLSEGVVPTSYLHFVPPSLVGTARLLRLGLSFCLVSHLFVFAEELVELRRRESEVWLLLPPEVLPSGDEGDLVHGHACLHLPTPRSSAGGVGGSIKAAAKLQTRPSQHTQNAASPRQTK